MSKRGLPIDIKMRHDSHYVEELTRNHKIVGRVLPLDRIEPNPEQPRVEIGDLSELSASIKEKGVLEPLLVKPYKGADRWLIIAGERRWRAAKIAGLTEVPCVELDVSEQDVAEIALIENLQRKDLTVWEEADALEALCRKFGYTHEDLAKKIGKSRTTVTESLTIANLPADIRGLCLSRGINSKINLLHIARQFDEELMRQAIEEIGGKDSGNIQKYKKSDIEKKNKNEDLSENTANHLHSTFPVMAFTFKHPDKSFKVEIKFKKPADKEELKMVLLDLLEKIDQS